MSNVNPQNSNHEEVDIIALFEYFRKGFNNFFQGFISLFLFFFKLIVNLYLLFKKRWILVFVIVVTFSLAGKFYYFIFPKSFYYEMIVKTNYDSSHELYSFVNSLQKDLEYKENHQNLSNKLNYTSEEIKSFKYFGIEPIKKFKNVLASYYGVNDSPYFPSKRDSIFYKNFTIDEYASNKIDPMDYSLQKVILISSRAVNPKNFEIALLNNINNFSVFKNRKEARLNALTSKETSLKKKLLIIDSILLNVSQQAKGLSVETPSLSLRGEAKNNVETDLLQQSREITDELFSIKIEIEKQDKVITLFSFIRQVEPDRLIKPLWYTGALLGFLISFLLLFGIEVNRFLSNYARENS